MKKSKLCVLVLASLVVMLASPNLNAQGVGGGGQVPDGGQPQQPQNPTQPPTTNNNGQQTADITNTGDGTVDPDNVDIELSEDVRNQGFVGATSSNIENLGFVGATSEVSGPPLAEDASFGGGVNSGNGRDISTGGGRNAGFNNAAENGFQFTRRNIRTRLRPNFSAPQIPGTQISNRFSGRFYRLPGSQNMGGQFQISIQNKKATVTGFVPSRTDGDRIVRQLRLEPGVYSIDNRLQYSQ